MLGSDASKPVVLEDRLGRIFIGSDSLLVFDGQNWSSHPKPNSYSLTSLVPGADGILWATTFYDFGYFKEEPIGTFSYHSLLPALPDSAREVDAVRGCAPIGAVTYFICKDKLLRWDGHAFQITLFPTSKRLSPLRLGNEFWFHHPESGLYRLTESGPELKVPADQLVAKLVIGLLRENTKLVTVSNEGMTRPGEPGPFSSTSLNEYLAKHRVSASVELPDGNLAIGTVSGGLVLASRAGNIIRIWADTGSGLPGRGISGLMADPTGELLGTTDGDFFHFPATGDSTVFNALNGLKGQVNDLVFWRSKLRAATDDGTYEQTPSEKGSQFVAAAGLSLRYNHMLSLPDGILLSRFGGVDWFDGTTVKEVYPLEANAVRLTKAARNNPRLFYVAEVNGLARLVRQADGSFKGTRFLELPESCYSLHEDTTGKLWIGTLTKGAFSYDPATDRLVSLQDPTTARPFQGQTWVVGDDSRILFFLNDRVLQANPQGEGLHPLSGLPAVSPSVVRTIPESSDIFIAYQRPAGASGPLHGTAILSFGTDGAPHWREIEVRSLEAIGSIRTVTFGEENGRRVLWLGGMQGILRLDYDRIPTLLPPTAPTIRIAGTPNGPLKYEAVPSYPYSNHRVQFRLFTGDYVEGKNLLFQTKLSHDGGDWSAPSARRMHEYTNLSEGEYRFEVRAVNTAGQTSPSAVFTFRILPPWYRSGWAFVSYAVSLLLAVFGFIRVRERRIKARNEELEGLVNVRTAELVKANAAKDEFLAGISHEIRNPMNGVIGIAENFRTDNLDVENRRKFSLLRQCASHLSSLLEDILDFSKVQAGAIELDPKPFDLPELVESVAGITRPDSEKYGIPVEVAVSPAVPRRLSGDARRIRQILINFVSNALKFSGRGQVSVTVWCKDLDPGRTEVIFAVSDEGPGISTDEQARLFTRFERGAAAQKGRVPGTGLGLALCKGLAEKMGGKIWLESELGRGSCFYFSAPFPVIETVAEPVATPASATASGRLALVVDDQEYNRIVLTDLLQSMGFTVQAAQEGQAALDAAAHKRFDVVFLDFNLPGLSGVDVARGIRALPGPTAHALILATTAFTTPEKRAQCLDAGMDAFLGKPVTRERLTNALAALGPNPTAARPAARPAIPAQAVPSAQKSDGPADRLGNLRLLARKKGVPFAQELAAYFADLDVEFANLNTALESENAEDAGRFAHMLCGRCSFIYARELEQEQRKVETAIADLHWAEARRHSQEFAHLLADLRVSSVSSDPAGPPA